MANADHCCGSAKRRVLRNLTRREELAHFLNERGNCLLDHLRMSEALEAYCHAQQLAPQDNGIRGNRVVASMIQRTLDGTKESATDWDGQIVDVQGLRFPQPRDAQEAWAMPHVKDTLARIMRIRRRHFGQPQTSGASEPNHTRNSTAKEF